MRTPWHGLTSPDVVTENRLPGDGAPETPRTEFMPGIKQEMLNYLSGFLEGIKIALLLTTNNICLPRLHFEVPVELDPDGLHQKTPRVREEGQGLVPNLANAGYVEERKVLLQEESL